MVMIAVTMTVKKVHERTRKNEDKRCVGENMLPVPDERANHHDGEDVVDPVGNAEVLHGWGWE